MIGGPNPFVLVINDFKSFADSMADKLTKEIDLAERPTARRISALP